MRSESCDGRVQRDEAGLLFTSRRGERDERSPASAATLWMIRADAEPVAMRERQTTVEPGEAGSGGRCLGWGGSWAGDGEVGWERCRSRVVGLRTRVIDGVPPDGQLGGAE